MLRQLYITNYEVINTQKYDFHEKKFTFNAILSVTDFILNMFDSGDKFIEILSEAKPMNTVI